MSQIVSARGVTKQVATGNASLVIVDDVSFEIARGETICEEARLLLPVGLVEGEVGDAEGVRTLDCAYLYKRDA